MDKILSDNRQVDNTDSMDFETPRKKRKTGESVPTIEKAHKKAKGSRAHKLRELYSAAKSLSDLDDSFADITEHQPECDNPLYEQFINDSQERIHNHVGSESSQSSGSSIRLGSSSSGESWATSSGSSLDSGTSSSYSRSQSPFWKSVAAAKIQKTPKNQSVDDFFDVQKDYLPFEEEKTEWADDTYLKQIVCCCFFKWWK